MTQPSTLGNVTWEQAATFAGIVATLMAAYVGFAGLRAKREQDRVAARQADKTTDIELGMKAMREALALRGEENDTLHERFVKVEANERQCREEVRSLRDWVAALAAQLRSLGFDPVARQRRNGEADDYRRSTD